MPYLLARSRGGMHGDRLGDGPAGPARDIGRPVRGGSAGLAAMMTAAHKAMGHMPRATEGPDGAPAT